MSSCAPAFNDFLNSQEITDASEDYQEKVQIEVEMVLFNNLITRGEKVSSLILTSFRNTFESCAYHSFAYCKTDLVKLFQ